MNQVAPVWLFWIKIVAKQILVKIQWLLELSSRNWSHARGQILKSPGFHRFLLNENVDQFILFSSRKIFHPPCYLKRALLWLQNYHQFFRFLLWGHPCRFEDTKRNAFDLWRFQYQTNQRKLAMDKVTLTLMNFAIIYIYFGNSQSSVSLRISTVASLLKVVSAISLTNLLKEDVKVQSCTLKKHW